MTVGYLVAIKNSLGVNVESVVHSDEWGADFGTSSISPVRVGRAVSLAGAPLDDSTYSLSMNPPTHGHG